MIDSNNFKINFKKLMCRIDYLLITNKNIYFYLK